jgi:hypothetical protein
MQALVVLLTALGAVSAIGENVTAYTTFYGAKVSSVHTRHTWPAIAKLTIPRVSQDNCPPGGDIAYPKIHKLAGGVGTYADPITFASSKKETPPGTIIYVFFLQKYFISATAPHIWGLLRTQPALTSTAVEDDCGECDSDWTKHKKYHFDLWTGPDAVTPGPNL